MLFYILYKLKCFKTVLLYYFYSLFPLYIMNIFHLLVVIAILFTCAENVDCLNGCNYPSFNSFPGYVFTNGDSPLVATGTDGGVYSKCDAANGYIGTAFGTVRCVQDVGASTFHIETINIPPTGCTLAPAAQRCTQAYVNAAYTGYNCNGGALVGTVCRASACADGFVGSASGSVTCTDGSPNTWTGAVFNGCSAGASCNALTQAGYNGCPTTAHYGTCSPTCASTTVESKWGGPSKIRCVLGKWMSDMGGEIIQLSGCV